MNFDDASELSNIFMNAPIRERFVFMLGSALSMPEVEGGPGIPNVSEMIQRARQTLNDVQRQELDNRLLQASSAYQETMAFLALRKGQDALNELICDSVLSTILNRDVVNVGPFDMSDDEALQNEVEEILGVWNIPAGLASFGKLVSQFGRRFGETVLTTNFDPLIGVAIRQAGGHYFRVCVTTDGDIRASGGSVSRVVHLHGYFHNSETLHTQSHLSMRRPHLEDSLKMLLLNKTIVVMGYGGWDDSLMRALSDIAVEPKCGTRIIWCFYERDERAIQTNCRHILGTLSAAYASGRLTLIKGFNVNQHLPELWNTLSSQELLLRKGLSAYVGKLAGLGDEFDFKPMSQVFNQVLGVDFAQAIEEHWCINSEKIFSVFENLDRSPVRNDVRTVVAWWLKAVYGDSVQLDVDPEGADSLLSDARN